MTLYPYEYVIPRGSRQGSGSAWSARTTFLTRRLVQQDQFRTRQATSSPMPVLSRIPILRRGILPSFRVVLQTLRLVGILETRAAYTVPFARAAGDINTHTYACPNPTRLRISPLVASRRPLRRNGSWWGRPDISFIVFLPVCVAELASWRAYGQFQHTSQGNGKLCSCSFSLGAFEKSSTGLVREPSCS